jgi:RNA polymerase sigma factor (sigma-70 family)
MRTRNIGLSSLDEHASRIREALVSGRSPVATDEIEFWRNATEFVRAKAAARCKPDDRVGADDVAQEILTDLWKQYPGFVLRLQGRCTTYLFGVMRNKMADAIRRVRRRGQKFEQFEDENVSHNPASTNSLEVGLERAQTVKRLRSLVRAMSLDDKVVVEHVKGNLTTDEACRALRSGPRSRAGLYRRQQRLLKKLRQQLG